jgi:hypothetical protein
MVSLSKRLMSARDLRERQGLLVRGQAEALPDAVLDPPEMLVVLDDVQVIGLNG